jgi:hypothetical protein
MGTPPLPRALRRFAEVLKLFDDSVTLPLGDLSRRLALLVGPLRAPARFGDGDPEGYDGLARKGPYDRLLLTEWLLADEMPDEFLRRAAAGEHAFLRLLRAAEVGHRRSVVLFDSGPSQLGGPRVVQLAALLLMASRAAQAGAAFHFGCLQSAASAVFEAIDEASIGAFLGARSLREANEEDVERWLDALGPLGADDDVWVVGSARLAGRLGGLSHLAIDEVVAEGGADVRAALVDAHGRLGRSVQLALPAEEVSRQLLRRPLRLKKVKRASTGDPALDPAGGIVFSPTGRRLFARRADGRLLSVGLPAKLHRRAKVHDVWPRQGDRGLVPIAVGWRRKRPLVVRVGAERLVIEGSFGPHDRPIYHHDLPLPPVIDADRLGFRMGRAFYCDTTGDGSRSILLFTYYQSDGQQRLLGALVDEPDTCLVRPVVLEPVETVGVKNDRLTAAFISERGHLEVRTWGPGWRSRDSDRVAHAGPRHGIAHAALGGDWERGQLIVEGGTVASLPHAFAHLQVAVVPRGGLLVGALCTQFDDVAPVAYLAARGALDVLGGAHRGRVDVRPWRPAGPVSTSPLEPVVAWATHEAVVVYDFRHGDGAPRYVLEVS